MYGESQPPRTNWGWLAWVRAHSPGPRSPLAELLRGYFNPTPIEQAGDGRLYRILGVPVWRRLLSPARAALRSLTARPAASVWAARPAVKRLQDARDGTCVIEALHLPFFLALLGLSIYHLIGGVPELALRYLALNLLANAYPIMAQRYVRLQIDQLLQTHGAPTSPMPT
jgi:hypothetical protein